MIELSFDLDFGVTLFTGEGNFKVDKDGNPWDITYLVHGDVKRYENASFNRPHSIRVTEETTGSNSSFDLINRNIWYSVFNKYVPDTLIITKTLRLVARLQFIMRRTLQVLMTRLYGFLDLSHHKC